MSLVDANYAEGINTPEAVDKTAGQVSDTKVQMMGIVSADPSTHVRKVKLLSRLGPTAIALMNVSGADPLGTLRTYGERVLPELRC